ncbi:juvenile hormone esterase-like [Episyrphus balteatus]|uniref:juvenile hormone esterase-like n=1 Tax=Episyrphus balteatus TaxID=286459 RepID=UPI0024864B32|nr:juvenile hormone esterase-like [Episyrphus balteatus]
MASSTKVTLKQGRVVGGTDTLPNGNSYYFFKGIPYAEPPIGKLRFKAPVPLKSFSAPEIECTKEGNICFHRDRFTGKYLGSEDCLFLNVYTPKIDSNGILPVMVYIHGGAFVTGSGNSDNYNPLYLMQENVIVVTMNYRLGPLGFLSFPEGNIPGNAGLKDQRLVLEWVQENISKFGGDQNNVTLFGQSAGAISAHFHVLSERSKKLFHKAILQSGLANMTWMVEDRPSFKTIQLAKMLGCSSEDPIEIIDFLQEHQDLEKFFEPIFKPPSLADLVTGCPVPAKPAIEEDSPEAVFTKPVLESMNNKNSIDIPLIIGCASADGTVVLPALIGALDKLESNLRYFVPGGHKYFEKLKDLEHAIKEFYFKEKNIDKTTLNQLNDLLTDFFFTTPIRETVELHSRKQHNSPLYFYRFDFEGALNLHKKKYKLENIIKGAAHCDELYYIFQAKSCPEPWSEREKKIVEVLCKMWANFAKYSNPTLGCEWMDVKKIEDGEEFLLPTFVIGDTRGMAENPCAERMDFWCNLKKTAHKRLAGLTESF